MGWVIALGIIAAYVGVGMVCVPFIARRRLEAHRAGYDCESCPYRGKDEETFQNCATIWASFAWAFWPVCLLIGFPKVIATGALAKDVEKAARLKELEAEAAEQDKRIQREIAILRANDPLTMTVADFERKVVEATLVPKSSNKMFTGRLTNPFR